MRWPRWVVLGAVIGGALAFVYFIATGGLVGLPFTPLMLALFEGVFAVGAAAVLLVAMTIDHLRRRPRAIDVSRASERVVAIVGVVLVVVAALAVVTGLPWPALVLGVVGVGLVTVTRTAWGRARPALALVAAILAFELPREAGWLSVHLARTTTAWSTDHSSTLCDGVDVGAIATGYVIEPALGGDIGELVAARSGGSAAAPLRLRAEGHVDMGGWFGCLLPLYKPVSFEAGVDLAGAVTLPDGRGTCQLSTTIVMRYEASTRGIASCRDVRLKAAATVTEILEMRARGLIEGQ